VPKRAISQQSQGGLSSQRSARSTQKIVTKQTESVYHTLRNKLTSSGLKSAVKRVGLSAQKQQSGSTSNLASARKFTGGQTTQRLQTQVKSMSSSRTNSVRSFNSTSGAPALRSTDIKVQPAFKVKPSKPASKATITSSTLNPMASLKLKSMARKKPKTIFSC